MTAPVPVASIFLSKLMIIGLLICVVQGILFLLYYAAGHLLGLPRELPEELFGWLLRGWIAGLTIGTLQLALSMRLRSFAVPVGMGLCATFLGLAMYVMDLGLFFPHSLLTIGMGVLNQSGLSSYREHVLFLLVNLFYMIIISLLAIRWLSKKDVVA